MTINLILLMFIIPVSTAILLLLQEIRTHLRHIADALEKMPDVMSSAITVGITEGANNAIYWWRQSR